MMQETNLTQRVQYLESEVRRFLLRMSELDNKCSTLLTIARVSVKHDKDQSAATERLLTDVSSMRNDLITLKFEFEKYKIQMEHFSTESFQFFKLANKHTAVLNAKHDAIQRLRTQVEKNTEMCATITKSFATLNDKYDRVDEAIVMLRQKVSKGSTYVDAFFKICGIVAALVAFGLTIKQLLVF